MSVTVESQWIARSSPTIATAIGSGFAGSSSAGSPSNRGVMQTADGLSIIMWVGGKVQWYDSTDDTWSAEVTLPAGCTPDGWTPVYHQRAVTYDRTNGNFLMVDFGTGATKANTTLGSSIQIKHPTSGSTITYIWGGGALVWSADWPGMFTVPASNLISTNNLMLLFDYRDGNKPPQLISMQTFDFAGDDQAYIYMVAGASRADTSSTAGALSGQPPGPAWRALGIGQKANSSGPYFDPATFWLPAARRYPIAGLPQPWRGSSGSVGGAILAANAGTLYSTPTTNFLASVAALTAAQADTVCGPISYAIARKSAGVLQTVQHVPVDFSGNRFGIPITVPAPSPLNALLWGLFTLGGVPYVLDGNARLYSLALALYNQRFAALDNWRKAIEA